MVTIDVDTVIQLAELMAALAVIGGGVLWCIKFVLRAIRKEQTLICYGILACLRGLKELDCDGPVTEALDKLEKHLNKAAHDEESLV